MKKLVVLIFSIFILTINQVQAGNHEISDFISTADIIGITNNYISLSDFESRNNLSYPFYFNPGDYIEERNALISLNYSRTDQSDVINNDWMLTVSYQLIDEFDGTILSNGFLNVNSGSKIIESKLIPLSSSDILHQTEHVITLRVTNVCVNTLSSTNCTSSTALLPEDINLELSLRRESYYSFQTGGLEPDIEDLKDCFLNIEIGIEGNLVSSNTEFEIYWPFNPGAESYDVEWVFIDKDDGLTTEDPFEFKSAVRINTSENYYKINLTYPEGELYYRYRSVGKFPEEGFDKIEFNRYGIWEGKEVYHCDNGQVTHISKEWGKLNISNVLAFEEGRIWTSTKTYAEEGKNKEVVQYFDESLRNRQSVTNLNTDENVLVAETKVDYEGRPVVSILPAPINTKDLGYKTDLNLFSSNVPFDKEIFDKDDKTDYLTSVSSGLNNFGLGAANYYSGNKNVSSINQDYIPDAEGYVYTQSQFKRDGTGRITRQSGVGKDFLLFGDHDTKYFYGSTTTAELQRLFGENVGNYKHYRKVYVQDPNGQISVSYQNKVGKTIATSLVGPIPDNLKTLNGSSKTIVSNLIDNDDSGSGENNNVYDPVSQTIVSDNTFINTSEGLPGQEYLFSYNLKTTAEELEGICHTCKFEVSIVVIDPDGFAQTLDPMTLPPEHIYSPVSAPYKKVTAKLSPIDCLSPEPEFSEEIEFNCTFTKLGEYRVIKTLKFIQEDPTDSQLEAMLLDELDIADYDEFLQLQLAEVDITQCDQNCEQTCQELEGTPEYDACVATCQNNILSNFGIIDTFLVNDCKSILEQIKQQLSPSGYYYENKSSDLYNFLINNTAAHPDIVLPTSLIDFQTNFNYDWLDVLVSYHPEFCHYSICMNFRESKRYDWDLNLIQNMEQAISHLDGTFDGVYNNEIEIEELVGSGAICFGSHDFTTDLINRLTSYATVANTVVDVLDYTDPDFPLYTHSNSPALVNNNNLVDINGTLFDVGPSQSSPGNNMYRNFTLYPYDPFATTAEQLSNLQWTTLRGQYLNAKQEIITQNIVPLYCVSAGTCLTAGYLTPENCSDLDQNELTPIVVNPIMDLPLTPDPNDPNTFINADQFQNDNIDLFTDFCYQSCEVKVAHWFQRINERIIMFSGIDLEDDSDPNYAVNQTHKANIIAYLSPYCDARCFEVEQLLLNNISGSGTTFNSLSIEEQLDLYDVIIDNDAVNLLNPPVPSNPMNNTFVDIENYISSNFSMTSNPGYFLANTSSPFVPGFDFEDRIDIWMGTILDNCSDIIQGDADYTAIKGHFETYLVNMSNIFNDKIQFYEEQVNSSGVYTHTLNDDPVGSLLEISSIMDLHNCSSFESNFSNSVNFVFHNAFVNGDLETGDPEIGDEDVDKAEGFEPIWSGGSSTADFWTENETTFIPIGSGGFQPSPSSGQYAGFWVNNNPGGASYREGLINRLKIPLQANSGSYRLSFEYTKMMTAGSNIGDGEIGIYGVSLPLNFDFSLNNPSLSTSPVPITVPNGTTPNFNPLNIQFFNGNSILLGTLPITSSINNGIKETAIINFSTNNLLNSDGITPINNITHILLSHSDQEINGGAKIYIGVDNFYLIDRVTESNALEIAQQNCIDYLYEQATLDAEYAWQDLLDEQLTKYLATNTTKCFNTIPTELFTAEYDLHEDHFTLYYYDQAGNLTQTVPPAGFVEWQTGDAETQHTLRTHYRYNSLNQLVWQSTPDGGESDFWYNDLGMLKLSQNAQQKEDYKHSYTNYDKLGRIVEVGEISGDIYYIDINESNFPPEAPPYNIKSQRTRTHYSDDDNLVFEPWQKNLKSRVAYLENTDMNDNLVSTTKYSYDVHGNVETLKQFIVDFGIEKTIDYEYDLISGNVNKVYFQKGAFDQYIHKYEYDADNRLTNVYTSRDDILWDEDAEYFYYAHGPLARVEIGEDKVQSLDYYYTLQGWLKGINMPDDEINTDPGKDGVHSANNLNNFNGQDEFGLALGYFEGDYTASGLGTDLGATSDPWANLTADLMPAFGGNAGNGKLGLFNGNIAWQMSNIAPNLEDPANNNHPFDYDATGNYGSLQTSAYQYDQLNRISQTRFYEQYNGTDWSKAGTNYDANYEYDANGNLTSLDRFTPTLSTNGGQMDQFTYNYNKATIGGVEKTYDNKLKHVDDAVGYDAIYTDIEDQAIDNYTYDNIGNLVEDASEQILEIKWTVYGKVKEVVRNNNSLKDNLEYLYDAMGNRVAKIVKPREWVDLVDGPTQVRGSEHWITTYYVRDASGNIMANYKKDESTKTIGYSGAPNTHDDFTKVVHAIGNLGHTFYENYEDIPFPAPHGYVILGGQLDISKLEEFDIYGSSRIGVNTPPDFKILNYTNFQLLKWQNNSWVYFDNEIKSNLGDQINLSINEEIVDYHKRELGMKSYELSNHLGNVMVVVSDKRKGQETGAPDGVADYYLADVVSAQDYYPFGSTMPGRMFTSKNYRFGFQGQEKENDITGIDGGHLLFKSRIHDPRLGRFLSKDPLMHRYPWNSPYSFAENRVIDGIDADGEGLEWFMLMFLEEQMFGTNHLQKIGYGAVKRAIEIGGGTIDGIFSAIEIVNQLNEIQKETLNDQLTSGTFYNQEQLTRANLFQRTIHDIMLMVGNEMKDEFEKLIIKAANGDEEAIGALLVEISLILFEFDELRHLKLLRHGDDVEVMRVVEHGEFGYSSYIDVSGRLRKVSGDLKLSNAKRLPHKSKTPGKLNGDHAGHMIADMFGGGSGYNNLVSQLGSLNKSAWLKMEYMWRKALREGKSVSVDIKINYFDKNSVRPESFDVTYKIDGVENKIHYDNTPLE